MRIRVSTGLLALATCCLSAQPAPGRLEFEVASIKPSEAPKGPRIAAGVTVDKQQILISNFSLRDIVMQAYKVRIHQVDGPDWMAGERFDIAAKLPAGATRDQIPQMLQSLLEDRFKLQLHREKKELPVYALVVAKNGPKLKPAEADSGIRMSMSPKGRELTAKVPLSKFADALSNMVDRPVVDMTKLEGAYDIALTWSGGDNAAMAMKMGGHAEMGPGPGGPGGAGGASPEASSDTDTGASIYTAIQEQLGLKLEATKAPLDILVIDRIEKVPTEN